MLPYYTKRGKSSSKQDIINIIGNGITLEGEDILEIFNEYNESNPVELQDLLQKPPNYADFDSDTEMDDPKFPVQVGDIVVLEN